MSRRLPKISRKTRICILCEGFEEHDYMRKLLSLEVWNDSYDISLVNAEGQGNLFARYQSYYQMDSHEAIFIITDTDAPPYDQYNWLKTKLNRHHHRQHAAKHLLFFGNPCTMQFILLHWEEAAELQLHSASKQVNAPLIYKLTGIRHYHARKSQRRKLCALINKKNYYLMRERSAELSHSEKKKGSSNFSTLINRLHAQPHEWLGNYHRALL